jgi:hypothetical protein
MSSPELLLDIEIVRVRLARPEVEAEPSMRTL